MVEPRFISDIVHSLLKVNMTSKLINEKVVKNELIFIYICRKGFILKSIEMVFMLFRKTRGWNEEQCLPKVYFL